MGLSSRRFVLAILSIAFISGVVLPQMSVQAAGPAGTAGSSGAAGSAGSSSAGSSGAGGASGAGGSSGTGGASGTGGSGSSGSSGGASSSGGGAHSTPTPSFGGPGGDIQSISQSAGQAIDLCNDKTPRCIADALDEYATALRALAPRMPPQFANLPVIVERAATRVRTARTKKEAIKAVTMAIAEVHKTIALLRADDPFRFRAQTREGAFVVQTLQVANDKLEKAVGL
jgi:hypothetical protein